MKNDTLMNKKVVKAISLALAAVMTATPMTALAEEEVVNDDDKKIDEQNATEVKSVDATQDAIDNAQNTLSNEETGNNVVLDDPMTLPSTGETLEVVPDAVEAAGSDDLAGVKTNLEDTIKELEEAENKLTDITDAEEAAAADAKEADAIIDEINANNKVVTDATEAADEAKAKAEEALEEAQSATNKADAQAAVDKATEAFGEVEAAQAAAKEAYDANVEKLAQAQAELAEAQADLEAAQKAKEATAEELAAAKAAVDKAVENAEALQAQVDADADALNQTKAAKLKAAYDEMVAKKVFKQYDGAAKDGADADNDGIGDEFTDEFGVEDAEGAYWTAARKYFELYLEYVYGDSYVKLSVARKNTLNNGWDYDAERDNTYTVTYKDENGELKTATYNYHTADNGDITIYEKQIATGMTEEVWGKETEEFEDTRLVDKVETKQEERSETTYEDALSIANTDNEGNVTYTKLDDVKKDTDKVVTASKDENDKVTSVLVKDDNSQLLASDEVELNSNQQIVEGTSKDTYTTTTIQVPASYGTKEVEEEYEDCISDYDDLVDYYNDFVSRYSEADGYVVRLYIHHLDGDMETISSLEAAKEFKTEAWFNGWLDRGYEIGVYKVVEDTTKVTSWADKQVIVKTTTATVETTTEVKVVSDKWYDTKNGAKNAAKIAAEKMGLKEGEYTIKTEGDDWWFDEDYKYIIIYNTTSTSEQVVKTEKYSGTVYEMNTIGTTRTWMETVTTTTKEEEKFTNTREIDVLLEESVEYEYWTERKNTSNDATVKNAIAEVEQKLEYMAAKKDEAAIALAAAKQAQADVAKAQDELDKLVIDNSASQAAATRLAAAQAAYEAAEANLTTLAEAAAAAEQNYVDAAKELGRFVPESTEGGDTGESTEGGDAGESTEGGDAGESTEGGDAGESTEGGDAGESTEGGDAGESTEDDATGESTGGDTTGGTTGGGTTGGTTGGGTLATATAEPAVAEAGLLVEGDAPVAPVTPVVVDEPEEEEETLVTIEDEDVPLAPGVDESEGQSIVEIEDEEVPLVAMPSEAEKASMPWWWLLIVALLGATGYKMYKDHQAKKEETTK